MATATLRVPPLDVQEAPCPWRQLPEAASLLAICGRNTPPTRVARYAFGETAIVYTGTEARQLRRLYNDHGANVCTYMNETGDDRPFKRWALDSVEAAIADAIQGSAEA